MRLGPSSPRLSQSPRRPGGRGRRRGARAPGTTLVEVLIAMVVVATAGLGSGAAITAALRADRSALQQTLASQRIDALQSRMQANPVGIEHHRYRLEVGYEALDAGAASSSDCASAGAVCNPDALAAADIAHWNAWNALLLPGGRGAIASGAGAGHTITIMWHEQPLGTGAMSVDPACAQKSPPDAVPGLRCLTRTVHR